MYTVGIYFIYAYNAHVVVHPYNYMYLSTCQLYMINKLHLLDMYNHFN